MPRARPAAVSVRRGLPPSSKRSADQEEKDEPATKSQRTGATSSSVAPEAVLVFAPGAGGSTAKAMRDLHESELRERGIHVMRCDDELLASGEARWVTKSAGADGNLAHVVAVATRAAAAHPGLPVFLCGASFGCRVLAEVLRLRRDELPSSVRADALICCGYPLHKLKAPEGADPRRAEHLLRLPPTVSTLFVQGEKDEFLGERGLTSLRETMGQMGGEAVLTEVPGGGHTVPSATGLKQRGTSQAEINVLVAEAIVAFTRVG